MQRVPRVRTTVLPGSKVELASPELQSGQTVAVAVFDRLSWKRARTHEDDAIF